MKKFIKSMITLAIIIAVLAFAGCAGEEPSASATPAPTASAAGTEASESNLKNAIKEGETYRYYVWNTEDENDPFKNVDGVRKEMAINNKAQFEEKYGVTIRYVLSAGGDDWYTVPFASAQAGTPMTDIFNAGSSYVTLLAYTYGGSAGQLLLPLGDYAEYGDFSDPEYWDQAAQEICTLGGKLYFCVPSPMGWELVSSNKVTLFNFDLVRRGGMEPEDLYEMSNNGEWTWDAFREAVIACNFPDENIYGTALGDNVGLMAALITSNDASYFEKQNYNGQLIDRYVGNSSNAIEAWNFFVRLSLEDAAIDLSGTAETTTFSAGRIAFLVTGLARTSTIYQRMQSDYGVLMPPKGPQADNYISDQDSFLPLCIFNGVSNPEGCVQVLGEYFRPAYARSSSENQALLEAELATYLRDAQSLEICKQLPDVSKVQSHMLYIKLRTASEDQAMLESVLYGHAWNFARGEETPAQYLDSIVDMVNSTVFNAINPEG